MNELTPARFDEFFQSLYGYEPFPWQAQLARQVADARPGESCWPGALALPTAAGKTACLDMAIFALACQADRCSEERTAARRIIFVVDRRVIVDATFERARDLAGKLHEAKDDGGIVRLVADRLRLTSGEDDPEQPPLACFQLRGGMYRDDAWARSPLQPTVVVTTVDQYGSRLLFRGYGSSPGMRPIHAGLAANDCLVLLDEAHCANPFRQTVTSVQRYRQWATEPGSIGATPFHFTLISATPPPGTKESFTDGEEDRKHEQLGRRINAPKLAKLAVAQNARGNDALERLAERIASEAQQLVGDDRRAIGIIVNRVATAQAIYRRLGQNGRDAILLTGRMRAIDRDDIAGGLQSLKTGAARDGREQFVVATQTLEVGADLDFDGLVTECASLDALRQRFGRLNRDGRDIEAKATVIVRADQANPAGKTADDPVYGAALSETWQWLNAKSVDGEVDFGYAAMEGIIPDQDELRKLSQQAPDAPVMLPAHVDAWTQTSPVPVPDPDVAIFLHGPQRSTPEVQVCWRSDLSEGDLSEGGQRAIDIVSLCPPASSECISVPIPRLRRWLEGNDETAGREDSDVEGAYVADDSPPQQRRQFRYRVLCWRGPEDSRPLAVLGNLHHGDTVVIPAESRGWDSLGHKPPDSPVDLGDRAYLQSRAKAIFRIHPDLVRRWPDAARALFERFSRQTEEPEDADEDEHDLRQAVSDLKELGDNDLTPQWTWLKDAASALLGDRRWKKLAHPGGGWVIQGSHRVQGYTNSAGTLTSEDDSYSATVRVLLDDHLEGVKSWAKRIGGGAGLPETTAADLALAARLHDVGKADPRFQLWMHGGNPWAVGLPLLAKSDKTRARGSGCRHELLSVRMIENSGLLESAHDKDLVLHLVASHHGHCRPFAPVVDNQNPVQVEQTILGIPMSACTDTQLERLDSGVPERFWKLTRSYGWWGLAWLESLMRVADHRCSEDEQKS